MNRARVCAVLAALGAIEPAAALASSLAAPTAPPARRSFAPDGRLEVVPTLGWVFFGRRLALANGFYYGGEIAHHFHFDHPWFVLGGYAGAEGSLSNVYGEPRRDVDVIVLGGGVTWGLRGLGRFLPVLRAGAGFIVADGTPSNLEIVARLQYHLGAGLRWYPLDWLVVRLEARVMIHENLQFGAGSGQLGDVAHLILAAGVGVAR